MIRFFEDLIPRRWTSTDGREPTPPKLPRRPANPGDPARPPGSGPWMVALAMLFVTALLFTLPFASGSGTQVDYSFFRSQLQEGESGNVKLVTFVEGTNKLTGEWKEP